MITISHERIGLVRWHLWLFPELMYELSQNINLKGFMEEINMYKILIYNRDFLTIKEGNRKPVYELSQNLNLNGFMKDIKWCKIVIYNRVFLTLKEDKRKTLILSNL